MKYTPHTMGYFLMWGALYGLALGGWSTTIMFPVIGTVFGLAWGAGIGVACGLLCGGIVSVIQAYTFHPDVDLPVYRVRLSLVMGVTVGITAPILLILTSNGILWGGYAADLPFYFLPSLAAVIFWGSLCGAYVGHGYPLWFAHMMTGHNYFAEERLGIVSTMEAIARPRMLYISLGLGGIIGIIMSVSDTLQYGASHDAASIVWRGAVGGALGMALSFLLILVIPLGVAALIVFLKRLLFSSDILSTASHFERLILTGAAALFTALICVWPSLIVSSRVSTVWVFPVFCGLFVGFYVYRALPTDLDKTKRKEAASLVTE